MLILPLEETLTRLNSEHILRCACRHVTESECRSMTTYFPLLLSNSGSISPPRFLCARLTSPNFNFLKINQSFHWAENNVEILVLMQSDFLWLPADNDHPEQESPDAPRDGVNHRAHTESPQVWNSDDFISVCFTFVFPLQKPLRWVLQLERGEFGWGSWEYPLGIQVPPKAKERPQR